jgi:hypothetical protein
MIKHIGRHNDKKVTILYRTVPKDEGMCLVLYSDLLPRTYHDAVMKVLESDVGQAADEFSDALFRNLLPDGRNILETLHKEGLIRKIPTSQVIVTPDARNSCRLDELNKMLEQIGLGKGPELAEAEALKGLRDPMRKKSDSSKTTSGSVTGEEEVVTETVSVPVTTSAKLSVDELAAGAKGEQTPAEILKEMKAAMAEVKRLEKALEKATAKVAKKKSTSTKSLPK